MNNEPLTPEQREFLQQLSALVQNYKVSFGYTNDDDGVHVSMHGQALLVGHINDTERATELIRARLAF